MTAGEDTGEGFEADTTGLVQVVRPRLADFAGDGPPLPAGYLLAVAGPDRGKGTRVDALPAVIGRANDAEIQILDDTVSRHHARLDGDTESLTIEDLGSANGVRLNGNAIVGTLHVRDGDLVELGATVLLVKLFT